MGFRQIYIKEANKLSFGNNSIIITKGKDDKELSFPLEDIDMIFVEDPQAIITTRLISEVSNYGISIIFCGKNYLPSTITAPINKHYQQTALLKLQINLLQSKKNKFWEFIIKQKIKNQMVVIENTTYDNETYNKLKNYLTMVKFGDEKNMEGLAAREYFKSLFGPRFIRFDDSPISSALNYGYSIISGAVIRTVAFAGLNDNIGIWHHNELNANNLSYDLVEVFRSIVDYYVYNHLEELTIPLTMDIRKGMVNLLNYYVKVDGKKYQVSYAIGLFVNEYINYLKHGNIENIKFPEFFVNEGDESSDE